MALQARSKLRASQGSTAILREKRLRSNAELVVTKRLLPANPCSGVEFPVGVKGLFRPHYVSWSEQKRIELHAQPHLRNIVPGGVTTGGAAGTAVRALSANHPKLNDRMARPAWWQGR